MLRRSVLPALLFAFIPAVTLAEGPSAGLSAPMTEKNWRDHPGIIEARSVYQSAKESKKDGQLMMTERRFDYCEPYEDTVRTLFKDRDGRPRIYRYEGGSEDSTVKRELYYDESGNLRFAFITAGAYNGTRLEDRVYFSNAGRKIWEFQRRLEGPGYAFPGEWPDAELIKDPARAFNGKSKCPEISPK